MDLVFLDLITLFDLRKEKDTGKGKRLIHIQVDPEQRRFIIRIQFLVEILVVFCSEFTRLARPGGCGIVDLPVFEENRHRQEPAEFLKNSLDSTLL